MSTLDRAFVSPVPIGRLAEMEWLEVALRQAGLGAGQCVLVSGEAGVGKSRLLAEVRAGSAGWVGHPGGALFRAGSVLPLRALD